MIYATELVTVSSQWTPKYFEEPLNEAIEKWQSQGLDVEVQYQGASGYWSALLIVRRPK